MSSFYSNQALWLLALSSLGGYAGLWVLIFKSRLNNDTAPASQKLALLSSPVLLLHGLLLIQIITKDTGIYLGLVNICCLIGWLMSAMTIFSSVYRPTINLSMFAFPIAALSIALVMLFPSKAPPLSNVELSVLSHIFLSLLAFSVFSISAGQALFIASMDYQLRNKLANSWHKNFPPLQTLENSLFEMISLGLILLSLSIVTGLLFLDNMFAQQVAHKTFFSIFSWIVFSALLFGKVKFGWRGSRAIQITLGGYSLLFLAFLGSKFVLEILLERA